MDIKDCPDAGERCGGSETPSQGSLMGKEGQGGGGDHHPGGEADNKDPGRSFQGRGQLPILHQVCAKPGMSYREHVLNPGQQGTRMLALIHDWADQPPGHTPDSPPSPRRTDTSSSPALVPSTGSLAKRWVPETGCTDLWGFPWKTAGSINPKELERQRRFSVGDLHRYQPTGACSQAPEQGCEQGSRLLSPPRQQAHPRPRAISPEERPRCALPASRQLTGFQSEIHLP